MLRISLPVIGEYRGRSYSAERDYTDRKTGETSKIAASYAVTVEITKPNGDLETAVFKTKTDPEPGCVKGRNYVFDVTIGTYNNALTLSLNEVKPVAKAQTPLPDFPVKS